MSSNVDVDGVFGIPIRALEYHDMSAQAVEAETAQRARQRSEPEMEAAALTERIRQERADAIQQTELRLRQEYELKLQAARVPIADALADFVKTRAEYFARVESEVVQLSLGIAAKILHREAQVDPMLVATLVRMAIEKLREGSNITIRVGRGHAPQWEAHFAGQTHGSVVAVVENAELSDHDCVLESELGLVNFGLDSQLKEVEQGFFDLLALRPANP